MRTNDELADELAKLIIESLKPPPPKRKLSPQEQREEGFRDILKAFEQRAREIDGDNAPVGLDAIQLRYYPHTVTPSTNEEGMTRLRRLVQRVLKLRQADQCGQLASATTVPSSQPGRAG